MNKIKAILGTAVLSLIFMCGCTPPDAGSNPQSTPDPDPFHLSGLAYNALVISGLIVESGEIFTTKYREGYNLNFEITQAEAASLLPAGFTPLPLKIIETDPVERYYLSWYMAVIDTDTESVNRIDLFTYATDPEGELTLQFVSSYISVSQTLINLGMLGIFHEIFDFFAMDSRTGAPAYPHYYTETLTVDAGGFNLVYPETSSSIELSGNDCIESTGNLFTRKFINANSQIYRNGYDKNVNYFNQTFSKASVETKKFSCLSHANLAGFHPMLDIANLKSIQNYGDPSKVITWYYETCNNGVCQNPF